MLKTDPEQWICGFGDAYRGEPIRMVEGDDHSYASGRIEGEALRLVHRQAWGLARQDRDQDGAVGFDHGYLGLRAEGRSVTYQEAFSEGTALRAEHEAGLEQALLGSRGRGLVG